LVLRGREGVGQDTEASTIINLRWFAFAVLTAACHHAAPDWADAPVEVPVYAKMGLPDDWFWVRASHLVPL
jgi:hypothetical protein